MRLAIAVSAVLFSAAHAPAQNLSRVSVDPLGVQANSVCWMSAISADGRWAAFSTNSSNLPPKDSDSYSDVYLKDLESGLTVKISVPPGDVDFPSLSGDGRYVVYRRQSEIWVRDTVTNTSTQVSTAFSGGDPDAECFGSSISDDGRFVAYSSSATNLVASDSNGMPDVFAYDRQTGVTERVSVDSNGVEGNGASYGSAYSIASRFLSADGRYVAFYSSSSNLVLGDVNGVEDVFVRDRVLGTTSLVSVSSAGVQGNADSIVPSISSDGRYVVFSSSSSTLVTGDNNGKSDIFVRDLLLGTTEIVSKKSTGAQSTGDSYVPTISGDGRYVAFESLGALVSGATNLWYDIYRFDRQTKTMLDLSKHSDSHMTDQDSLYCAIDASGDRVIFGSGSSTLLAPDLNITGDVFLWREAPTPSVPTSYCTGKTGINGCVPSVHANGEPSLSSAFYVTVDQVDVAGNNYPGLLMYGVSGRAASPFSGGALCIAPPVRRSPVTVSQSFPITGFCTGLISMNMTAFAHGLIGGSPLPQLLVPGTTVDCQFWLRDAFGGTQLSNALEYVAAP